MLGSCYSSNFGTSPLHEKAMKSENPINNRKAHPARLASPSIAANDQPVNASANLSPEIIFAKSCTTTQLLVEILGRHSTGRQPSPRE
jgi:hypothetical protein